MVKKLLFMSLGVTSFGILVFLALVFQKQQPEVVAEIVSENSVLNTVVNSAVVVKNKGSEIVAKVLGKEVPVKQYKYQDDPTFDLVKLSGLQDSTNIHYRNEFYAKKDHALVLYVIENPSGDDALDIVKEYEIVYDIMYGLDFPEESRKLLRENHYQMQVAFIATDGLREAEKITKEQWAQRQQETFDTYFIDGNKKLLTDEEFKLLFDGKGKNEVPHGYWNFYEAAMCASPDCSRQ